MTDFPWLHQAEGRVVKAGPGVPFILRGPLAVGRCRWWEGPSFWFFMAFAGHLFSPRGPH